MTEVREQRGSDASNTTESGDPRDPRNRKGTPIAEIEKELKNLGGDENIAELLANNWQRFLVGLGLALLAVWLYNEYRQASTTRQYSAAETFSGAQEAFAKLSSIPDPTSDAAKEAKKLFDENIRLINSSKTNETNTQFAKLYQAQLMISQRDYSEADRLLEPYLASSSKAERASLESISADLAGLIKARSLVAQGKLPEARTVLLGVLSRGGVGAIEAAVALGALIEDDKQKAELLEAAKKTNDAYPELSELLIAELRKIGLSFIK